jgi:hypothetical protein
MLSMGICLEQRVSQRIEQRRRTYSCMPRLEEALEYSDYEPDESYRDAVDGFLCETMPEWEPHCRAYYARKGKRLAAQLMALELWDAEAARAAA